MDDGETANPGPPLETIDPVFAVTERKVRDGTLRYYGTPRLPPETLLSELWPAFHEEGYELRLERRRDDGAPPRGDHDRPIENGGQPPIQNGGRMVRGEYVLIAEPAELGIDGIPWTNVVLFLATVLSTLFVGSQWYYVDPFADPVGAALEAWPFAAAILLVLGVHEMGHYVMSRYHRVQASLPYFLPVPTLIGTMGAVIKMKGRMPNRKALFDIGVAGPIAGLIATVAVTIVGLHLDPVTAPQSIANDPDAVEIRLGYPPMLELLAAAFDQPLYRDDPTTAINPVVVGGWVGMFITFLNLIPVGQLDGGHILRSMAGDLQETIAAIVPGVLFAFAGYLYYVGGYGGTSVSVWVIWGVFATLLAAAGPANPVDDTKLGRRRIALGVLTFVLGALCFMPIPVEIIE
ncbi:site-2 protease family protein [Natrialbaceae archaeon A-gly3]